MGWNGGKPLHDSSEAVVCAEPLSINTVTPRIKWSVKAVTKEGLQRKELRRSGIKKEALINKPWSHKEETLGRQKRLAKLWKGKHNISTIKKPSCVFFRAFSSRLMLLSTSGASNIGSGQRIWWRSCFLYVVGINPTLNFPHLRIKWTFWSNELVQSRSFLD